MEAESAGVRASAGDRAAPHAVRAAERAGLDLSGHTPTGVASVDLSAYDRIVAVDPSVARRLQSEHDVDPDRLVTWSIPDPVGGSLLDYQHCLQHVQQAVDALQAS
jgi:protein-tyrosine-phosphatase